MSLGREIKDFVESYSAMQNQSRASDQWANSPYNPQSPTYGQWQRSNANSGGIPPSVNNGLTKAYNSGAPLPSVVPGGPVVGMATPAARGNGVLPLIARGIRSLIGSAPSSQTPVPANSGVMSFDPTGPVPTADPTTPGGTYARGGAVQHFDAGGMALDTRAYAAGRQHGEQDVIDRLSRMVGAPDGPPSPQSSDYPPLGPRNPAPDPSGVGDAPMAQPGDMVPFNPVPGPDGTLQAPPTPQPASAAPPVGAPAGPGTPAPARGPTSTPQGALPLNDQTRTAAYNPDVDGPGQIPPGVITGGAATPPAGQAAPQNGSVSRETSGGGEGSMASPPGLHGAWENEQSGLSKALDGGLKYAATVFHQNDPGGIPGAPNPQKEAGAAALRAGVGAAPSSAIQAMDRTLGAIPGVSRESAYSMKRMVNGYNYLVSTGQTDKANKMSFEIMQYSAMKASEYGQRAVEALSKGDMKSADANLINAYDHIPTGSHLKIDGNKVSEVDTKTGHVIQSGTFTSQEYFNLVLGLSNKSAAWQIMSQRAAMTPEAHKARADASKEEMDELRKENLKASIKLKEKRLAKPTGGTAKGPTDADLKMNAILDKKGVTPLPAEPATAPPVTVNVEGGDGGDGGPDGSGTDAGGKVPDMYSTPPASVLRLKPGTKSQASPVSPDATTTNRTPATPKGNSRLPPAKNKFDSDLTEADEENFQKWGDRLPPNLRATADYDLRGLYKQLRGKDVGGPEGTHAPDTFKKPNHVTFSDQSKYHGVDGNIGGHWGKDPDGKETFTATRQNIMNAGGEVPFKAYMAKVEPGIRVVMPPAPPAGTDDPDAIPKNRNGEPQMLYQGKPVEQIEPKGGTFNTPEPPRAYVEDPEEQKLIPQLSNQGKSRYQMRVATHRRQVEADHAAWLRDKAGFEKSNKEDRKTFHDRIKAEATAKHAYNFTPEAYTKFVDDPNEGVGVKMDQLVKDATTQPDLMPDGSKNSHAGEPNEHAGKTIFDDTTINDGSPNSRYNFAAHKNDLKKMAASLAGTNPDDRSPEMALRLVEKLTRVGDKPSDRGYQPLGVDGAGNVIVRLLGDKGQPTSREVHIGTGTFGVIKDMVRQRYVREDARREREAEAEVKKTSDAKAQQDQAMGVVGLAKRVGTTFDRHNVYKNQVVPKGPVGLGPLAPYAGGALPLRKSPAGP